LNEVIPGRKQQIEFVKLYQPAVITLTAGGNDVGFGKVLSACVNPINEWATTCSYAKDDSMKSVLGSSIQDAYAKLQRLYKDLFAASGNKAKIYVLGYPLFVNPDAPDSQCELNVRLNKAERQMVKEGIVYMNDVIETAAKSVGVKYLDIENSLEGNRLCDTGEKYMTGIAFWSRSEMQESFHPNARGQNAIAASVAQQLQPSSLLDYDICPEAESNVCPDTATVAPHPPPFFASAMQAQTGTVTYGGIAEDKVVKRSQLRIATGSYVFNQDSLVKVMVYSDPISLGRYPVNTNGGLAASVTLPAPIRAGYHTVVLSGESYSGEPITLFQVIEVTGSNPSDTDEDGVADGKDPCLYVEPSGIDSDSDGVDDACDPSIGTKQAYAPTIDARTNANIDREVASSPVHHEYIRPEVASNVTKNIALEKQHNDPHSLKVARLPEDGEVLAGSTKSPSQLDTGGDNNRSEEEKVTRKPYVAIVSLLCTVSIMMIAHQINRKKKRYNE
jgi:lysophospholipase L1-like esterase